MTEIIEAEEGRNMTPSTPLSSPTHSNSTSTMDSKSRRGSELGPYETGPRAWIVIAAYFFLHLIEMGILKSFGVLVSELVVQFDTNPETLGFIIGLYHGISYVLASFIAPLSKQEALVRPLMLTGCFIMGISLSLSSISPNIAWFTLAMAASGVGFSLIAVMTFMVFSLYFDRRFAIAFGMGDVGCAVSVIIPLATEKILEYYGWRGTILILGGLAFNMFIFCAILRDPRTLGKRRAKGALYSEVKEEEGDCHELAEPNKDIAKEEFQYDPLQVSVEDQPQIVKSHKLKDLLLRPIRWLWRVLDWSLCRDEPYLICIFLATFIFGMITTAWYIFLISHAVAKGITLSRAVLLSVASGAGDAVGRFSQGPIIHNRWMTCIGLFMVLAGLNSAVFFCDPLLESFEWLAFGTLLNGIFFGSQMSLSAIMLKEYTPASRLSTSYGLSCVAFGFSEPIGGFTAGWIASVLGYDMMFVFLGGLGLLSIISLVPAYIHYCRPSKNTVVEETKCE